MTTLHVHHYTPQPKLSAGDALDLAARLLMDKDPGKTYAEAFTAATAKYPNLTEAYAAIPPASEQPDDRGRAQAVAGNELDRLARQRMTMMAGESYSAALKHVMAANPALKEAYAGGKTK